MRELFDPHYTEQVALELIKNIPVEAVVKFLCREKSGTQPQREE